MKSLLDIQKDIRVLEKNIQEINECVKNINTDITTIRNSSEDVTIDYSKIEALAEQLDFEKHPLSKIRNDRTRQIYLEMLLNIVRLNQDEESIVNRLIFIQWIQIQFKCKKSLEELYIDSLNDNKQMIYEMVKVLSKNYKESFLVDALIVANITGIVSDEIYQYLADISSILGFSISEVKNLAFVSRVVLSQNLSCASRENLYFLLDRFDSFEHYLMDISNRDIIRLLRVIAVELPDNEASNFKWKVKQNQIVAKGEVIATYTKEKLVYMEIKAPVDGKLFQFRNNNTNYGVIAHKYDNKDSIKDWVKSKNKKL